MNRRFYALLALLWCIVTPGFSQTEVTITDADLVGNTTYNWTKDNVYILEGLVYLEEGGVLNIEAGTVIKGKAVPSSSLIITRGAQIFAEGTAEEPIIMTSDLDDLSVTDDLTATDNQTWGGLIMLGNAPIGEDVLAEEGIPVDVIEGIPSTELRIRYGGTDPEDNSGVLRYVSLRHGGTVLAADNEINGLTLGGVGSGTVIDYIEVFANKDDGIEIFGGTVNIRHAVVAFCGDDQYDIDESWDGFIQFAFSLQVEGPDGLGDHAFEYDGSEAADRSPQTIGRIYNGTFIGSGVGATNTSSNGLRLREDAAAQFWNCIWTESTDYMFRIDDTSVDRLAAGESAFANNIVYNYGSYVNGDNQTVIDALAAGGTDLDVDPQLGGISRMPDGGLDPRPNAGSPALSGAALVSEATVIRTGFRGAFDNDNNWAEGWTALSDYGYFGDLATDQPTVEEVIVDADIEAGETLTLTNDKEYLLDGYVYVEEGATLNIQAGTVVRGKAVPSNGDQTSALIIARGGMINAEGTADQPIIMTSELDDLAVTDDLTATDNQTWGGLIVLGNAPIGEDIGEGEAFPTDVIEGIPSDEPRIRYGGTDADDNSGVIKYVSLRHGGSVLGADNEINGLTLGGVGAGTEIDYIEVFANKDDGIEIFGGTVNIKHAVVAFCGDDSYDVDESWDGFIQFALSLQNEDIDGLGDHAVEYDGSEAADRSPQTVGRIYNATFIGAGLGATNTSSNGLRLREDAAAQFWNCIWMESTDYMFRIDDTSVDRLAAGESAFANNIVYNYGSYVRGDDQTVIDALAAGGTDLDVDPMLGGISRQPDGGFDPRPNAGSPALSGAALVTEATVIRTGFRGAFDNDNNWALGWTALDAYGYFGDLVTDQPTQLETIVDASIEAGESLTLTNDKEYLMDGYVYVEEGATLTIQAGTVVRGKTVPTNGDQTSALIIARGGTIIAEGTADQPIIMTSELDDLAVTDDLTATDNQTWGGLIILGNAPIGEDIGEGEAFPTDVIEGIPSDEPRIRYGGTDADDNSGVVKYVSLRHGGSVLGADNEINGLTLGGVGAGTEIDYIEVFANKDDGIEIFGGTVNIKHAVVAFCGDDSYDVDESWDGFIQFALSMQNADVDGLGDHAVEYDGSEAADRSPQTIGRIYNATFIGAGLGAMNTSSNGLRLREDAAAQFWNCIWMESTDYMFRIDDTSVDRLAAGESAFANNIVYNYGSYVRGDDQTVIDALAAGGTDLDVDPMLGGISRQPDGGFDPRPNAGSPALSGAALVSEATVIRTGFRGAFDNSNNWALGWTAMDAYGYFGDLNTKEAVEAEVIVDASINAGETLTLEAGKEYLMDGYVYVEEGATLVIPAGTVLRGKTVPSNGDQTSALIIARGGRIEASGTAQQPIIMTSELDDLSTTEDLTATDNQTWGGLIILGNAPIGEDIGEGEAFPTDVIEGIPSDEARIRYGGTDADDSSGFLRYVSLRHGGSVLGADNEINGLTLGGVGAGTTIDYVEVFANKDDGIEIFGGTVNLKHTVVAFVGDDSYDFDESWAGSMQYLFSIQSDAVDGLGDHAVEYDGSEAADRSPQTVGRIYNATFIGAGEGSMNTSSNGLRLREDAAAQFWNCIWTESTDYMFRIDDTSVDRLAAGESAFANNIVFGYGSYVRGDNQTVIDALAAGGTALDVDPQLRGVSRIPDGGLDPRPVWGSPALGGVAFDANKDDYIDDTGYRGAFDGSTNWALGWTAMDAYGYFDQAVSVAEFGQSTSGIKLNVPAPNPVVNKVANVSFEIPATSDISLVVYDMAGRMIQNVDLGRFEKGAHNYGLNVAKYQTGNYVMGLITDMGTVTQKMTVLNRK